MILPAYLQDADGTDTFLRCFLFQYFPEAEVWEAYRLKWDRYPTLGDLVTDALLSTWSTDPRRAEQVIALAKRVLFTEEFFTVQEWHSTQDLAELIMRIPGFNASATDDLLNDLPRNTSSHSTTQLASSVD